jgi:outer membrane protein OmpA-like peptidoglycan-associated protein
MSIGTIEEWMEAEVAPPPRSGRERVRWVQASMNRILSLRLREDGIDGPATRSAVRSFQQRQGLTADGVVGPRTEAAIVAALGARGPSGGSPRPDELLSGFDFDRDQLKPQHQQQIERLARRILTSRGRPAPVSAVRVVGHTDPVGSDAYNLDLGRRRAERVAAELRAALERLRPGSSRGVAITVESRGEREATPGDLSRSRRVELFLSSSGQRPRRPRRPGCAPQKARIRLHIKILSNPKVPIARMLRRMREVYGPAGFRVEVASTERLRVANLSVLDVGACTVGSTTAEQRALFANRRGVGRNEVVVYFVRATNPPFNGCAAHPAGRPGAVVARGATEWTLAHEVGHVLGLAHVNNNDRLMTGNGTASITNPPPDLNAAEIKSMDASPLTITC